MPKVLPRKGIIEAAIDPAANFCFFLFMAWVMVGDGIESDQNEGKL